MTYCSTRDPALCKTSIETKVTSYERGVASLHFIAFRFMSETTFSSNLVLPLLLLPYIFGLETLEVHKKSFWKFLST